MVVMSVEPPICKRSPNQRRNPQRPDERKVASASETHRKEDAGADEPFQAGCAYVGRQSGCDDDVACNRAAPQAPHGRVGERAHGQVKGYGCELVGEEQPTRRTAGGILRELAVERSEDEGRAGVDEDEETDREESMGEQGGESYV